MAYPEVRIYAWFIRKTERRLGYVPPPYALSGFGSLSRVDEISRSFLQMDSEHMENLTLTDGIAEVDDSFRLVMTEDALPYLDQFLDSVDYPVIGITVGNRLFGPYDVEEYGFSGESRSVVFTGRVDREFQDTVIDKYRSVFFNSARPNNTKLGRLLATAEPYVTWIALDDSLHNFIIGKMAGAKDLSSIRGTLNQYAIGVSPLVQLSNIVLSGNNISIAIRRDIDVYPKYSTTIAGVPPERQYVSYLKAGFRGQYLVAAALQRIPN